METCTSGVPALYLLRHIPSGKKINMASSLPLSHKRKEEITRN
uniref:Uncharacterized protein n=1 Tax=Arundo donax TaxID=35708 RepID=A0A0A9SM33_ARUDO